MGAREAELAIHRKNTERFIASDPSVITLIPKVATKTAGTVGFEDGIPRDSQIFKVIWQTDSNIQRSTSETGGVRRLDFVLVGQFTAEVAIGDYFEHGGCRYSVEWIAPPNGYEVKAGGVAHGKLPSL